MKEGISKTEQEMRKKGVKERGREGGMEVERVRKGGTEGEGMEEEKEGGRKGPWRIHCGKRREG